MLLMSAVIAVIAFYLSVGAIFIKSIVLMSVGLGTFSVSLFVILLRHKKLLKSRVVK